MDIERYNALRALVERMYAMSGAGQWDEVAALLTDDFKIVEAENLPYGGVIEGKDALQRLYTHVFGFWSDPAVEVHDVVVSDNNAICLLTLHATSKFNSERVAMHIAEVFHLRGDKISGITPYYFDTAMVARATGTLKA